MGRLRGVKKLERFEGFVFWIMEDGYQFLGYGCLFFVIVF